MNIKEKLVDSSRIIGDMVAEYVGENKDRFYEIVKLTLYEEKPMASRAGRVLDLCTEKYPYLILPHLDEIFKHIKEGKILHRSILKVFAEEDITLDEEKDGLLLDSCIEWLLMSGQEVAVQIFCMSILLKFGKKEPELINEIIEVIENILPEGSAGVKNRGIRTIKELQKIKSNIS